jgi:hypothetical protein
MNRISDTLREMADNLDRDFWGQQHHVAEILAKMIWEILKRKPKEGDYSINQERPNAR